MSEQAPSPQVSVVILTFNEEINLGDCLQSCAWCDDVHVVDSGSTDGTLRIAEQYGVPVHTHAFKSFGDQRNWATDHVPTRHPWIFHLDADERFTPALVHELRARLAAEPDVDAFRVPHKMILHGTWLRRAEGYPVYQVRLFHRDRMRFTDHGHGQREPASATLATLDEPYLHEAYHRGIFDWVRRHNVHSQREAEAVVAGESEVRALAVFSMDRTRRRRAIKSLTLRLPLRPWLRWFHILFLQRGILDGRAAWRYAELMRLYDQMTVTKVRYLRAEHPARD